MEKEEHKYLETSYQKIMEEVCIVGALGRILENIYLTGNTIKQADLEYLIRVQNFHLDIIRSNLNDFELYLMHQDLD